jgi:DNA polymerase I-like protein with 3'-5' exonuclease and polymerase domains
VIPAYITEHKFASILEDATARGWCFDFERAERFVAILSVERAELDTTLATLFPPETVSYFTPKKRMERQKVVIFNPGSRQQIADRLTKLHGWKPKEFTETGLPKVDETILQALPWKEAKLLAHRFLLTKRLGQVAEGQQGWMRVARKQEDGSWRIHCRILHIGTVTHRCSHSGPNLGQVPANSAPYGSECRSLFIPSKGMRAVGADASGLELRCLANRMGDSAFTSELLSGDVHTMLQHTWGVDDRNLGKRLTYALIYGAGDAKLGQVLGGTAKDGKAARERVMRGLPALKRLTVKVKQQAASGYVEALDGRKIPVRNMHSALNTQLQSDGAVVMKVATISAEESMVAKGFTPEDYGLVGHIHDEMQYEADPSVVATLTRCLTDGFLAAGNQLGMSVPIEGEAQVGDSWRDTH